MASRPHVSSTVPVPRPPRELTVAGSMGLGVGVLATAAAYGSYTYAGGPTWASLAIIPLSVLIVAGLHVRLSRRRRRREGEWVVLGYTAAMILSTVLLTVHEALQSLAATLDQTVW